jgi:hypothetical protein
MSENSGFEYAVSTETSKNPIPNHTLRRDSYADATVDLAHDSRSIIPSALTLLNFRSPHTLDSNEPSTEEEERDRHATNSLDSHDPSREEEERDRIHMVQDIARTARKMVLHLTISVVFQVRL